MHREIQNLGIETKMLRNAVVKHIIPLIIIFLEIRSTVADSISPEVSNLSNFNFKLIQISLFGDFIRVLDKLKQKLVEIRFYINTLLVRVHIFTHKHKVRVDLKFAIHAQNETHIVKFTGSLVKLGN